METNCFWQYFTYSNDESTVEYIHMHILILLVSAICYSSNVIYHDTEHIIWLRNGNSEFAYMLAFQQVY